MGPTAEEVADAEEPIGLTHQQMMDMIMYERWPMHPAECDDDVIDKYLANIGTASKLDLREKALVRKVMFMLSTRIRRKNLSDRHLDILGQFLVDLINTDDHQQSLIVLGRRDQIKRGAPAKDEEVRWKETRELYEWLTEMGESDEEALRQAWDVWNFNPSGKQKYTFEQASKHSSGEHRSDGTAKSIYEQQVEMLKVKLNKAGSRVPAKRGRKPAAKKT